MSSDRAPKKHFILIGVAVACLVLAGAVFGIYQATRTTSIKVVDQGRLKDLSDKVDRLKNLPKFPSSKMKKWLDHLKARDPKLAKMSNTSIVMAGIIDPGNSDFRTRYLINMSDEDFAFLVFCYAQTVNFAPDAEVLPEEAQSTLDKVTYQVQDLPMPSDLGTNKKFDIYKSLYNPEMFPEHYEIEVAGMEKGRNPPKIDRDWLISKVQVKKQFGDDYVGVSRDGRLLALSDGVSNSPNSILTAKASVDLAVEFFERHPEASLRTHSWRLLDAIVRFIRYFRIDGKATFTVVETVKSFGAQQVIILNVGDSGCSIVSSKDEILGKTPVGQHQFNTPHQIPGSVEKSSNSSAENAKLYKASVPSGARVILHSDGVTDNVWPATFAKLKYAADIAAAAVHVIMQGEADNPYAKAKGDNSIRKPDDVSVIVWRPN